MDLNGQPADADTTAPDDTTAIDDPQVGEDHLQVDDTGSGISPEGETDLAPDTDEGDEPGPTSLAGLSEATGLSEDQLSDVTVTAVVNGKHAEVPISELVTSYQIQSAAEDRLSAAKEKAQSITSEAQAAAKQDVGIAAGLVKSVEQWFLEQISGGNLDELRTKDPTRYMLEKDRINEARHALTMIKQQVGGALESHMNQTLSDEQIAEEHGKLIGKMPSLKEDVARAKLGQYLMSEGFSRDEIGATPDHRLYVLAEKARQFDELKAKASKTKPKAKARKPLKPGPSETTKPAADATDHASILYPQG